MTTRITRLIGSGIAFTACNSSRQSQNYVLPLSEVASAVWVARRRLRQVGGPKTAAETSSYLIGVMPSQLPRNQ